MPSVPTPQPGILDIALYQGGASHIEGVTDILKLSSNENPYGASPKALEAAAQAAQQLGYETSIDSGKPLASMFVFIAI